MSVRLSTLKQANVSLLFCLCAAAAAPSLLHNVVAVLPPPSALICTGVIARHMKSDGSISSDPNLFILQLHRVCLSVCSSDTRQEAVIFQTPQADFRLLYFVCLFVFVLCLRDINHA
ncbi:hypothetical protein AMECASPLE_001092 [Ameca splendens]|uniref:Secreted protein n=1 Tax=Ameca splendens TaxID=208324 RepID=A0ABV0XLX4_9TELE